MGKKHNSETKKAAAKKSNSSSDIEIIACKYDVICVKSLTPGKANKCVFISKNMMLFVLHDYDDNCCNCKMMMMLLWLKFATMI